MSDLISRKKLKAIIEPMVGIFEDDGSFWWSRDSVLSVINSELVEAEPKVGKWVRITQDVGLRPHQYMCSECHRIIEYSSSESPRLLEMKYPYCHCGAKMERSE